MLVAIAFVNAIAANKSTGNVYETILFYTYSPGMSYLSGHYDVIVMYVSVEHDPAVLPAGQI